MRKKSSGFSLIELLVVISIICILTVVGIASYMNFSRSQTVTQTARKIVQDMRLAQSLANNGQKPEANVCTPSCQTLDGYTFSLIHSSTSNSYTISANCLPAVICKAIKSETLALDFDFIGLSAVKFKVLRRGMEFTGGNTLTVTAFTKLKKIILDEGGSIIIEGETPTP